MKPETLGASGLTYEKFSLNELRAKQLHEMRVNCRSLWFIKQKSIAEIRIANSSPDNNFSIFNV
jgi:hypothetical protein